MIDSGAAVEFTPQQRPIIEFKSHGEVRLPQGKFSGSLFATIVGEESNPDSLQLRLFRKNPLDDQTASRMDDFGYVIAQLHRRVAREQIERSVRTSHGFYPPISRRAASVVNESVSVPKYGITHTGNGLVGFSIIPNNHVAIRLADVIKKNDIAAIANCISASVNELNQVLNRTTLDKLGHMGDLGREMGQNLDRYARRYFRLDLGEATSLSLPTSTWNNQFSQPNSSTG